MMLVRYWTTRVSVVTAVLSVVTASDLSLSGSNTMIGGSDVSSPDPFNGLTEEQRRQELVNKLEGSLLSFFGFRSQPPVHASTVRVPPFMMALYTQRAALDAGQHVTDPHENDILANIVRSYKHKEKSVRLPMGSHQQYIHFNVSSIHPNETVKSAKVRISYVPHRLAPLQAVNTLKGTRRRSLGQDALFIQRVRIFDVIRPPRKGNEHVIRLLDTALLDVRSNGTAVLDVASAVHRWLKKPRTNYGLFVEVKPVKSKYSQFSDASHVRLRRDTTVSEETWLDEKPLLVVHTDDGNAKPRVRRNSHPKRHREYCQRHKLYVEFRRVEWHKWIVAPHGYEAYFCQGECPYPLAEHLNATNHAVVQNLVHSKYPTRVPQACCVPTSLSPLSMLYLDEEENVVLKTYQDMSVDACGCR